MKKKSRLEMMEWKIVNPLWLKDYLNPIPWYRDIRFWSLFFSVVIVALILFQLLLAPVYLKIGFSQGILQGIAQCGLR